jgi:hypothetical protein
VERGLRWIEAYEPWRFASAGAALFLLLVLGAFAVAAYSGRTVPGDWIAAAALLAIAAGTVLYALRLGRAPA